MEHVNITLGYIHEYDHTNYAAICSKMKSDDKKSNYDFLSGNSSVGSAVGNFSQSVSQSDCYIYYILRSLFMDSNSYVLSFIIITCR